VLQHGAVWEAALPGLHRAGWLAKLYAADDADGMLRQALAVLDALPETGTRLDRRVLASNIARNPHALDDSEPLAALALALLSAAGITSFAQRSRAAWDAVGVDCDDLAGGLIAVGIHPAGWHLPAGAAVTLPPRELASCRWPQGPRYPPMDVRHREPFRRFRRSRPRGDRRTCTSPVHVRDAVGCRDSRYRPAHRCRLADSDPRGLRRGRHRACRGGARRGTILPPVAHGRQ